MAERVWDGKDAYNNSPIRRNISELGPTKAYLPVGPINANSKTIRDYLDVMRTQYISVWQLAALAGGLQAFLFFSSQQAQDTVASLLFEQVQHWCLRSPLRRASQQPGARGPGWLGRREPALPQCVAACACTRHIGSRRSPLTLTSTQGAAAARVVPDVQAPPHTELPQRPLRPDGDVRAVGAHRSRHTARGATAGGAEEEREP